MKEVPILCITGTTGSGKNEIGARVAARLGGQVISLDSMKVYRGMDIGTAKPTAAERAMAPHHLIDILDPREAGMHLRAYIDRAEEVIRELNRQGKPAIIVGGTAMYLMGLLYGVYDGPSRNEAFRARLQVEKEKFGAPALHARLAAIDPDAAAKIDPNDYKRIERGLEMATVGGIRPSDVRSAWHSDPPRASLNWMITWPRPVLRERIECRVDRMFEDGWIDEVQRILDTGGFGKESLMALGYREIIAHIEGKIDLSTCRTLIKTKTWQFSRRQLTWMKKLEPKTVIMREGGVGAEAVAERIIAGFLPAFQAATRGA